MRYDTFLSRSATAMQHSAIRVMGALSARNPRIISFAPGYPGAETFEWAEFREIAAEILNGSDPAALQYGPTRGYGELIDALPDIMAPRGVRAQPDELIVTTGSQQGLDLAARVLTDPGDVVLVELPTYVGAISALRNVQARMAGVRQQEDGVDLDDLASVLHRERAAGHIVRVLYVTPNFQNPTGQLISREKRGALLDFASRHDLLIVEDDPYGDLYFANVDAPADTRPIKADDTEGRVIYLSSFSKTLAPGFRAAWVVAPPPISAKFELAKQASDLCTGPLDQRIVYEAWKRGLLERLAPRLRSLYQAKRDAMEQALRQHATGLASWFTPRGGFFIWVAAPEGVDAMHLLDRAVAHEVIYVVGAAFRVDGGGANFMRLSFSHPPIDQIAEGIARLAAALKEETATVAQ